MRLKSISLLVFQLLTFIAFSQTRPFQNKVGYFDYEAIPVHQVVDSSGNHYVLGHFTGVLTISGVTIETKGDKDIYIVKYDSQNKFQWMKSFGSAAVDNARSMSCDKAGNIYVTGQFLGNTFYASDKMPLNILSGYQQSRFLFKLSSSGETLWAKRFSGTTATTDITAQVFNDHEGRLYVIHPNRANGTLNTWNYNDSIISNPQKQYLNIPRWLMARLDPESGNLKWVDYIANPRVSANLINFVKISKPQVDSKNNILFSITYDGTNIDPIYIFGEYVAVNPRVNNVLVKIDSSGTVKKIRDLGLNNTSISTQSELAINANDEPVLITNKGIINYDGFYRDYSVNNSFNIARVFDTSFVLKSVVKLGDQIIASYSFDKENRLLTLGMVGTLPGEKDKTIFVDSITSKTVNIGDFSVNGYFRYDQNLNFDTLFIDRKFLSSTALQGIMPNSLSFSSKGNIILTGAVVGGSYGLTNNAVIRYSKNFEPVNINYGKYNDMPEVINGIEEDSSGSIYVSGYINQRADFESAAGTTVVQIPVENRTDYFIAKYNANNNLDWIKRFWKNGGESGPPLKIGKDAIYALISSSSSDNWNLDSTQLSNDGKMVLLKLGFDGKVIWIKKLPDAAMGMSYSAIHILKNGKILISGFLNSNITLDNKPINKLVNRGNSILMTFSPNNGDFLDYNVFALSNESLSVIGTTTNSIHEDNSGNLYLGVNASIINLSASNTFTEIFSRKNNKIRFENIWITQSGLLKLDSTLEIQKFKTFRSYFKLANIGGIDTTILFSAYAKGPSFNYDTIGGVIKIPLQNFSTASHFVHFTGLLDPQLNIKNISKLDTTSVESAIDIFSRKFYVDRKRKEIYESFSFVGNTLVDSTEHRITSVGSKDLLFLKYDSTGILMGGERLGTPQTDNFIEAFASSGGLIFSTQTVNPQYQSQFLKMKNTYQFQKNSIDKIEEIDTDKIIAFSSTSTNSVNLDVLSPENYVSKKLSMLEIGRKPDTTIVGTGALNLCQGSTSYITVNNATGIKWKKNDLFLNGETGDSLAIFSSGTYKAIIQTAEGREDSTRAVVVNFYNKPAAPTVTASALCLGTTTSALTATAAGSNTLKWYGTSSTGGTASATAPTPSSVTAGVTNYYVSQVNAEGCESDRSALAFTVHPKPAAPTVAASALCAGTATTALTATAAGSNTLKWYGTSSTGGTASGTAPTPSSVTAGVTNYYVSQVNAEGCESDRSVLAFTVHPKPVAPTVSNLSVCIGGSTTSLTATAAGSNTLKWYSTSSTGGTANTVAPTPSSSTIGETTYYVSQISTYSCESDRASLKVTINALPEKPSITWNGNELSTASTYANYQWLFNDSTISGANAYQHKPSSSGNYKVRVANVNQCNEVSSVLTLLVTALSNPLFEGKNVRVFPNPTNGKCTVDLGQHPQKVVTIRLFNTAGAELGRWNTRQKSTVLDLEHLPSGNYLLEIRNANTKITASVIKN